MKISKNRIKSQIIDPAHILPDRIIPSQLIATLSPPLRIDNMEALSVEQKAGRTIIWIASDDNFNPLQRTVLMRFALRR